MSDQNAGGARRGKLGRGLSSLLGDGAADGGNRDNAARPLPIDKIHANPKQPRQHFSEAALADLTASIAAKGILQPILVRPTPGDAADGYEIIAGERRWRAAQRAGLHEMPALVRTLDDTAVLEIALIENVQRADLGPIEEADGYQRLVDDFGRSHDEIAEAIGKSRSHVANLIRLLGLPGGVQKMVMDGRLSAGHGRALLAAADPAAAAAEVLRDGLSVRQTEALVKRRDAGQETIAKTAQVKQAMKDADTRALEADLSARLGLQTVISFDQNTGGGRISFAYRDLDELDGLIARVTAGGAGNDSASK
ncbi:MAG: ParB/RepB/Spo0J family partition protein [Rhodospirillaceae bacterium]